VICECVKHQQESKFGGGPCKSCCLERQVGEEKRKTEMNGNLLEEEEKKVKENGRDR
jgi:hypothetical protein